MNYKKAFLLLGLVAVVVAGVFFATVSFGTGKYDIEHITAESKDIVFYTDDKPVDVVFVDKQVQKKSGDKSDLVASKGDVVVWIE